MSEITISTTLTSVTCCNCGMLFAMPKRITEELRKTHEGFYCPAGHRQFYLAESEEEKLRRELNRQKQQNARLEEEANAAAMLADKERRARAAVEARERRSKKRTAAGVCPCCNRSFVALRRHMATKHPAFIAEEARGQ